MTQPQTISCVISQKSCEDENGGMCYLFVFPFLFVKSR